MAFEAYLLQGTVPRSAARRLTYLLSGILHGAAVLIAVAYSFWHVEEVKPPAVTVTFISAAAAPPPPPTRSRRRVARHQAPGRADPPQGRRRTQDPSVVAAPGRAGGRDPRARSQGGGPRGVEGGVEGSDALERRRPGGAGQGGSPHGHRRWRERRRSRRQRHHAELGRHLPTSVPGRPAKALGSRSRLPSLFAYARSAIQGNRQDLRRDLWRGRKCHGPQTSASDPRSKRDHQTQADLAVQALDRERRRGSFLLLRQFRIHH